MSRRQAMRVTVDRRGEVHVDLIGYLGEECAAEEERLRDALASFGLAVEVDALRGKSPKEMVAEARALSSQQAAVDPARESKGRLR